MNLGGQMRAGLCLAGSGVAAELGIRGGLASGGGVAGGVDGGQHGLDVVVVPIADQTKPPMKPRMKPWRQRGLRLRVPAEP